MDIRNETLIPLKMAKRYLLGPVNDDTLRRWCRQGVFRKGEYVILESVREGGRMFTSEEAIERFRIRLSQR